MVKSFWLLVTLTRRIWNGDFTGRLHGYIMEPRRRSPTGLGEQRTSAPGGCLYFYPVCLCLSCFPFPTYSLTSTSLWSSPLSLSENFLGSMAPIVTMKCQHGTQCPTHNSPKPCGLIPPDCCEAGRDWLPQGLVFTPGPVGHRPWYWASLMFSREGICWRRDCMLYR